MNTYRVVWEIDVEAESALDAALMAEDIMHDYASDGHRPVLDVYSDPAMPDAPLGIPAYDKAGLTWEEIDLESQPDSVEEDT